MQRWHARFPGSIHDIAYETLVSKPEQTISDLLAFCGLNMEPACLASHKNKRAVRTASVAQVRQPIYKDAVRASAPFEVGLTRLREILASGEGGLP